VLADDIALNNSFAVTNDDVGCLGFGIEGNVLEIIEHPQNAFRGDGLLAVSHHSEDNVRRHRADIRMLGLEVLHHDFASAFD
jgi:hypothetical protein